MGTDTLVGPDILLINPWVYDFACYDFWLKPFGLLKIGGLLRKNGYRVKLYDFLNPYHPAIIDKVKRQRYGTGHFFKVAIPKDRRLLDVPRKYYRYGLPYEVVYSDLRRMGRPSLILVASGMTYWVSGLIATVNLLRKVFGDVPIIIGGIYATLCYEHAKDTFKNEIIFNGDTDELLDIISRMVKPGGEPSSNAYPIFDEYERIDYVVISTSRGCPYSCSYCASRVLNPYFEERDYREVFEEIVFWYKRYRVLDFAFYDDALLFNFENRLGPLLDQLLKSNVRVRFHTPNGIHTKYIDRSIARLLKLSGFKTLRLGVERLSFRLDTKTNREEVERAIGYLREAGFTKEEIGAYMMFGFPDEDWDLLVRDIITLDNMGVSVYLAEFSPVPRTPLFDHVRATSRYDLDEPIFHNNSIFPALKKPDWERIQHIKNMVRSLRKN